MKQQFYKLDNGMKIILIPVSEFKSVYTELRLHAGPEFETDLSKLGISHFIEHMVLQGTESFPDEDAISNTIDFYGGGYGGETGYDYMSFTINLPYDQIALAVKFMEEISFSPVFDENHYKKEKKVILDEAHSYLNRPGEKYSRFFNRSRYQKDAGTYPIIGYKKNIKAITLDDIKNIHKQIFVPQNMTLSVCGDIDIEEVKELISKSFESVDSVQSDFLKVRNPLRHCDKAVSIQVDKNEKNALGSFSVPSTSRNGSTLTELAIHRLIPLVLTRKRQSLLFKKLRKENGLLYDISSSIYFDEDTPGLLEIYFQTSDDKVQQVAEMIQNELIKLYTEGVDTELYSFLHESNLNALKMGYTSLGGMADWYTGFAFRDEVLLTLDDVIEILNSVSVDDFNSTFRKLMDTERKSWIFRVNSEKTKKVLQKEFEPLKQGSLG